MRRMGMGDGNLVVVYDGAGIFSAPRVWWMLRAMGHDKVAVLDGGLPAWKAAGGAIESGPAQPKAAAFTARRNSGILRDFGAVMAALEVDSADAGCTQRRALRGQRGTEPRPGVTPRPYARRGEYSLPQLSSPATAR